MSHITIKWNGDEAKTSIKPSFYELYDMARLDCLKDAIYDLTQAYQKELTLFNMPITTKN